MRAHLLLAALLSLQSAEEGYQLGKRLYQEGKLLDAESVLKRTLELEPNFTPAQFQLGAVYVRLERLVEAAALFEKVLGRYPREPGGRAANRFRLPHGG